MQLWRILALPTLLLVLAPLACGPAQPESSATTERGERVILAGHLYSLGVLDHVEGEAAALRDDRWLEALADEIEARAPAAVFFLGDSTRDGKLGEWQRLDRVFKDVDAPIHHLAGNHDLRSPEVFDEQGGVRNRVFDIGPQRFIALDNKCVYEDDDLDFLKASLAVEGPRQPIILMHYCMLDWKEAQPGQDPREDYPGVSNWNRDVVPLLAGRVRGVICGDHIPGGPRHRIQNHGGHEIRYYLSSFVFGQGQDGAASEGPNIYLELEIAADETRIRPGLLTLPLDDPWYRDPRPVRSWPLHEIAGEAGWIWLPPAFRSATPRTWIDVEKGIEIRFDIQERETAASFESILARLSLELRKNEPQLRTLVGGDFKKAGRAARWEWLEDQGGRRFFAVFQVENRIWLLAGKQEARSVPDFDARALFLEVAATWKPR